MHCKKPHVEIPFRSIFTKHRKWPKSSFKPSSSLAFATMGACHTSPHRPSHLRRCRAIFVAERTRPQLGQGFCAGTYTRDPLWLSCRTSPRAPPFPSAAAQALLCLAMLFFDTSLLHFSHLLRSLLDATAPPHCLE